MLGNGADVVPREFLVTASRFAAALDAEDYSAAQRLLAPNCVYRIGDATVAGPEAIISSYRVNGDAARQRFDDIAYDSNVAPTGASSAAISFTDRLRIGNESHEFHCRQHVWVGSSGLIEEITHEELPDERQRLADFEAGVDSDR